MVKYYLRKLVRAVGRYGNIHNYTLPGKIAYSVIAVIFLASTIIPTLQFIQDARAFRLSSTAQKLLDTPSQKLANKFTYNAQAKTYHFNEKEKVTETASADPNPAAAMQQMQTTVAGKDGPEKILYSVDMPENIEQGFTYYDNSLKLSFKLIPEGQTGKGTLKDDRLIYKLADGTSAVFTAKNNGIKEDIILTVPPEDNDMTWRYTLDLPKTLEARMMDDGGLGIYSADPSLFGNISYGSDADREKVMSARESGVKNYLVFGIPAPVIKETTNTTNATAKFILSSDNKTLSVLTTNLHKATYPISVDPTVVITSTSDFTNGNNEGNINFASAGEISGFQQTGGSIGAFTTTSPMNYERALMDSFSYNGYLYAIGDWTNDRTSIEYAPILSDGSVGAWTLQLNAMPENRYAFGLTVYNGNIYIISGNNGSEQQNTYYTKINANGSVNTSWTLSPNIITGPRYWLAATAYDGYLYASGGRLEGGLDINSYSDVWKTKVNADGSIGTWSTTTAMPTARAYHSMAAYNGYMYIAGGQYWDNSPIGAANDVYVNEFIYAPINSDGTLGAWITALDIPSGSRLGKLILHGGYAYFENYSNSAAYLYYTPVRADGSLGSSWAQSQLLGTANAAGMAVYNNRIYTYGGSIGTSIDITTVKYATISPPGTTTPYTVGSASGSSARLGAASVAIGGYIYAIGGHSGSAYLATIQKATLAANGTVGAWISGGTSLATTRAFAAASFYKGRLYVSGGTNGTVINDIQYISIDPTTGNTTGAWAAGGTPGARYKHSLAMYNGYAYIVGGDDGATQLNTTFIGTVNLSTGNIPSWVAGTAFTTARRGAGVTMQGNKIFLAGGYDGTNVRSDVQYATITPDTGSMSAWTISGNSLATARSGLALESFNGCLYAVGGVTSVTGETSSASSVATTVVEYSCLDATNLPTAWGAAPSLLTARSYMGSGVVNGTLSVVGGAANGVVGVTPVNSSANAAVNHGGTGSLATWTTSPNAFSPARNGLMSVAYNGYLYISGGADGGAYDNVSKAAINPDGSIGTWAVTTNLQQAVYGHGMIAYNGFMYIIAGAGNSGVIGNVYRTAIDSTTGNLGASWTSETSTIPRALHGTAQYNGYLYVVGGQTGTGGFPGFDPIVTAGVQHAKINANGSLQAWVTAPDIPGVGRAYVTTVIANGYVYGIGGANGSGFNNKLRLAYASKIQSDGTLGTWFAVAQLPSSNSSSPMSGDSYGGYVYLPHSTFVARAQVLSDGQLGEWTISSGTYPVPNRSQMAFKIYRGVAYMSGGINTTASLNDTSYVKLDIVESRGTYSKLIDFGSPRYLSSINFNGLFDDSKGSVTYSVAGNSAVFGSRLPASSIVLPLINCLSIPTTRYLMLRVEFDNSYRYSGFPAVSLSDKTQVQDITIQSEPAMRGPTENRLFQGKWFDSGSLNPYDTCQ